MIWLEKKSRSGADSSDIFGNSEYGPQHHDLKGFQVKVGGINVFWGGGTTAFW